MIQTKVRRSRKTRWCVRDFAHPTRINPGDLYGIHVASPTDSDVGTGHWQTMISCLACATEYNNQPLIDYYARDRKGIAAVAAIHQRKEATQ